MTFNSVSYFVFLIITLIAFYVVRKLPFQRLVLLIASFIFIWSYNWLSVFIILGICFINFNLLNKVSAYRQSANGRKLFLAGIFFNASVLIVYKIVQLFKSNNSYRNVGYDNLWIILGVSFYSLQFIGYYFEVYKRKVPFTYTFSEFVLSVAFFAKLPAGPILQINQSFNTDQATSFSLKEGNIAFGIQRILLGIFKKVALADRLIYYVSDVFDQHKYINGFLIYLAPFLFTMQVYFDFSAYIDIAVGTARLFGIQLPENFNMPLRAKSITNFWRRWHISLTNWLTAYIFYPLSYSFRKLKKKGLAIAVLITLLFSALWHGIAITFVVWGLCHVAYILLENTFFANHLRRKSGFLKKTLSVFIVWHLVAFANLFFRSASIHDAFRLFQDFRNLPFLYEPAIGFKTWLINGGQDIEAEFNFRLSLLLALLFLAFEKKINKQANSENYSVVYVTLIIVAIIIFGMYNTGERFIYLQF